MGSSAAAQTFTASWVLPVTAPPIREGSVVVRQGRIAWVGPRADRPAEFGGSERHFEGVLLPAFVNAHVHAHLGRLQNGRDPAAGFAAWLRAVTAQQSGLTSDGAAMAVRQSLAEMGECGTAAVGHVSPDPPLAPFVEAPVHSVVWKELVGFPTARATPVWSEALKWIAAADEAVKATRGRVRASLAVHAPYSASAELCRRAAQFARRARRPLTVHLAETPEEEELVHSARGPLRLLLEEIGSWDPGFRGTGLSPVAYAAQVGLLDAHGVAAHCNYLSDDDVEHLKRGRLTPTWCPGSWRAFGHADHPAARLIAAGVPVALATDSLASSESLALHAEARLAAEVFPDIAAERWIEGITIVPARALGVHSALGSLEVAKRGALLAVSCPGGAGDDPARAALSAGAGVEWTNASPTARSAR